MSQIIIRPITSDDEAFLWQMLYYAALMNEDDNKTVEDAKVDAFLKKYVEEWGKPKDLGFIAAIDQKAVGAVWIRHFEDEEYPELAIAVSPDAIGQGIGSQLLQHIIEHSKGKYTAISLAVRTNNPAYRLYQRFGFKTTREVGNRVGTVSYEMILTL